MSVAAFRKTGVNAAESQEGFAVRSIGRGQVEYRENDHALLIEVEDGRRPTGEYYMAISAPSIKAWEPPFQAEVIGDDERHEIIRRVVEAHAFLGVPTVLE